MEKQKHFISLIKEWNEMIYNYARESKNNIKQSPKQQLLAPPTELRVLPHNSGLQRQQTCGINPDDFEEMPETSDNDDDEGPSINRVLIQPQRELNCHSNNLKEISEKSSGIQ